jgi:hypothetical protein
VGRNSVEWICVAEIDCWWAVVGRNRVEWICVAEMDCWWAVVSMVMNLRVPRNVEFYDNLKSF